MPSVTPYGNGWRCQVYVKGERDSQTFESKRDAQRWGAQRDQEMRAAKKAGGQTFKAAVDRYKLEVSSKKDGKAWEELRLARMLEYFGESKRLGDIQAPEISAWKNHRLEGSDDRRAVTGSTVLREANLLRNVFTVARDEWHWIDHNPFKGVSLPEEGEPRWQRWDWKRIKRVLRKLGHVTGKKPKTKNQEVALAFLITLSTSLRASEVLRVSAKTYDAVKGVVAVKAKGRLRSEIPIPRRGRKHCALASFTIDADGLDALFRKARDATMAGDLTFHDGRATALTLLAKRVELLALSRISQHRDLKKLQIYYRETGPEIAARI